ADTININAVVRRVSVDLEADSMPVVDTDVGCESFDIGTAAAVNAPFALRAARERVLVHDGVRQSVGRLNAGSRRARIRQKPQVRCVVEYRLPPIQAAGRQCSPTHATDVHAPLKANSRAPVRGPIIDIGSGILRGYLNAQ